MYLCRNYIHNNSLQLSEIIHFYITITDETKYIKKELFTMKKFDNEININYNRIINHQQ